MTRHADLIVVGGGTAGCAVAARASEDPAREVLLIEAGPDPRPVPAIVRDPRRQQELVRESDLVRRYPVVRPDGSRFELYSGRVMGGGSAVNNLAIARPMARDFDDWVAYGGPGWSYAALLPLMRTLEHDEDFGESELHGGSGPLRLRRDFKPSVPGDPPVQALIAAAAALGLPTCDDLNVTEPFGICASPYNLVGAERQSSATAYLDPARERPNLAILAGTRVNRLVLSGARVTGVEVQAGPLREVIEADEVVLSAGVYHSPQILLLSGIGPAAVIEGLGGRLVQRLDGVGENYQDHAVADMRFLATAAFLPEHRLPKVRLVARSSDALELPDLHVLIRSPRRAPDGSATLAASVRLLEHRSRGRIRLASADPAELPLVEHALLEDAADRAAVVNGMRLVARLTGTAPLAAFYGELVEPRPDADWEAYVMATFDSYHHGVGTCRIGPADDPGAVVDPRLRVHGIENLRVADASVLPTIPRANTNLPALLVGEIAARELGATA